MIAFYLTHPQVAIDPRVAVPDWSLSELGRNRILASRDKPWLRQIKRIIASDECKAQEAAQLIGDAIGVAVETQPNMGENDRSSTGFITPDKFEAAADAFFANPDVSWNGWEKARDAQTRIVTAIDKALNERVGDSPVLFVGHGAVGALFRCHISGKPISRREDQPGGGGNLYAFDIASRKLLCEWAPIENFDEERFAE